MRLTPVLILFLSSSALLSSAQVDSELGEYSTAAIAIDGRPCAEIGM